MIALGHGSRPRLNPPRPAQTRLGRGCLAGAIPLGCASHVVGWVLSRTPPPKSVVHILGAGAAPDLTMALGGREPIRKAKSVDRGPLDVVVAVLAVVPFLIGLGAVCVHAAGPGLSRLVRWCRADFGIQRRKSLCR